jgi:hypothetical protein
MESKSGAPMARPARPHWAPHYLPSRPRGQLLPGRQPNAPGVLRVPPPLRPALPPPAPFAAFSKGGPWSPAAVARAAEARPTCAKSMPPPQALAPAGEAALGETGADHPASGEQGRAWKRARADEFATGSPSPEMTDGGAVMAPARANPVGETAPAPAPAAPGAPAAPPGAPAAAAAESGAAD